MKKILATMFLIMAAMTGVFAAGSRDTQATVEGKLAVTNAIPSIVSGDKTWFLPPGPFYRLAWENAIKAGDTIKAEGYVREDCQISETDSGTMLMPSKVWVNGKQVDLSTVASGMGRGMGSCMGQGMNGNSGRGGMGRMDGFGSGPRGNNGNRGN